MKPEAVVGRVGSPFRDANIEQIFFCAKFFAENSAIICIGFRLEGAVGGRPPSEEGVSLPGEGGGSALRYACRFLGRMVFRYVNIL